MIVVDTMIFAYALLRVERYCDDAAAVLEAAWAIERGRGVRVHVEGLSFFMSAKTG